MGTVEHNTDLSNVAIIDYNHIIGFVNYGTISMEDMSSSYATKMRCKECGNAWLAENYIGGIDTCPKCGATDKSIISVR